MIGAVCCLSGLVASAATNRVEEITLTADRTVNVAAGDVCEVGGLYADDNFTLTKTGPGELLVHDVSGAAKVKVDVQAGAFNVIPAEPSVCTNSYIHLDAARASTLTTAETSGMQLVSKWADAHGRAMTATPVNAKPELLANGLNGMPVVSCRTLRNKGSGGPCVGAGADLGFTRSTTVRDVILVAADDESIKTIKSTYDAYKSLAEDNATNGNAPFLVGDSSKFHFHRGKFADGLGAKLGFSNNMSSLIKTTGLTYLDEQVVAPCSTRLPDGFHLVAFRASGDVAACYFGRDRALTMGGCRFAESMVFTDAPVATNAHARIRNWLLWKWFNKGTGTLRQVTVGAGARATLVPGVKILDAAADDFAGDLTVPAGKTLTLVSPLAGSASRGAHIRLDASQASTLTTNAAGKVTSWADANGNGKSAAYGNNAVARVADTPAGLTALDCGPYWNNSVLKNVTGSSYFTFSGSTNVRDVVMTVADREDIKYIKTNYTDYASLPELSSNNANGPFFIGYKYVQSKSLSYAFSRGKMAADDYPYLAFSQMHPYILTDGQVYLDGVVVAPKTTRMKAGYHVVGYRASNDVWADRLADDRSLGRGGCKLAEVFVFTNRLVDADYLAISTALQAKWLKSGTGALRTVGNLTVETGATLEAPETGLEVSGTLTLDGTNRAYRVRANNLVVGANAYVDGTLVVSNSTVTLSMDADGNVIPLAAKAVAVDGPGFLGFTGSAASLIDKGPVKLVATPYLWDSLHPEAKWKCVDRSVRVKLVPAADGIYGTFVGGGCVIIVK